MKKYAIAFVLPLALAWGCKDDIEQKVSIAEPGDEVEFTYAAVRSSRTIYDNNWNGNLEGEEYKQQIYWGDYVNASQTDSVMIFCPQGARTYGEYAITPQDNNNNVSSTIVRLGDAGVQWGADAVTHDFFSFYPSQRVRNNQITTTTENGTDHYWVDVELAYGQDPVRYYGWKGQNPDFNAAPDYNYMYEAPRTVPSDPTNDLDNRVTWQALPNMKNAIMVARTSVTAGSEEYGNSVPLNYSVLADVLDFTISGPITPNRLNGNDNKDFITVQSVTLRAKEGSGIQAITGYFKVDILTGECVPQGNQTSIQLTTAGRRDPKDSDSGMPLYPILFVRSQTAPSATNPYTVDQLRLRAFLIPGQVKNLSDLEVVVSTDCGEYVQQLDDSANWHPAQGEIYKVKLPYFNFEGQPFDFTKWMSQLDDNIYITELSIPGTWHSSVANFQGGEDNIDYVKQYNAGIRAFEVQATNSMSDEVKVNSKSDNWTVTLGNISYSAGTSTRTATVPFTATGSADMTFSRNTQLINYYTRNNVVDGMTTIHNVMNESAFVVVEIGMIGEASGSSYEPGQYNVTSVEGTMSIQQTLNGNIWTPDITPEYIQGQLNLEDTKAISSYKSAQGEIQRKDYTDSEAWAYAVYDALEQLANNGVIYKDRITRNTTLGDVRGHILIKINTNGAENGTGLNETLWRNSTPALFSRWMSGSGAEPLTINLNWGQAILPGIGGVGDLLTGDDDLRWCYTELDAVSDIDARKTAIDKIGNAIYNNYSLGLHRTWYEIAIGGYMYSLGANLASCRIVASELNPYLLNVMTAPDRRLIPFGLVYMNCALADNNTYHGADLIRAIINNNNAFRLNRKDAAASPAVQDNTNSHFSNSPGNPLK